MNTLILIELLRRQIRSIDAEQNVDGELDNVVSALNTIEALFTQLVKELESPLTDDRPAVALSPIEPAYKAGYDAGVSEMKTETKTLYNANDSEIEKMLGNGWCVAFEHVFIGFGEVQHVVRFERKILSPIYVPDKDESPDLPPDPRPSSFSLEQLLERRF